MYLDEKGIEVAKKYYEATGIIPPELMAVITDNEVIGIIRNGGFTPLSKLPITFRPRIISIMINFGGITAEEIAINGMVKSCKLIAEAASKAAEANTNRFTPEEKFNALWNHNGPF